MKRKPRQVEVYFYPDVKPVEDTRVQLGEKGTEEAKIRKLSDLAKLLREQMEFSKASSWEISIEGYLELSTGFLPGGKSGFKTVLKIASQPK